MICDTGRADFPNPQPALEYVAAFSVVLCSLSFRRREHISKSMKSMTMGGLRSGCRQKKTRRSGAPPGISL